MFYFLSIPSIELAYQTQNLGLRVKLFK